MSTALIITTLDEVTGVKNVVPRIKKEWVDEIIFVDGGSTDGTIEEAEKMGFKVIIQKQKGLGAGIIEGVNAIKSDNFILFGPDGNDEPEKIPKIIEKFKENCDQVAATRFGKGSINLDAGPIDAFGNRMFTFLVNTFFGGRLTDSLFGFKIIKKDVFNNLNLDGEFLTLEQQMSIKSCKYNLKIAEIDGREPKRIGGEAKMKPLETGYALSKQIIKEFVRW